MKNMAGALGEWPIRLVITGRSGVRLNSYAYFAFQNSCCFRLAHDQKRLC